MESLPSTNQTNPSPKDDKSFFVIKHKPKLNQTKDSTTKFQGKRLTITQQPSSTSHNTQLFIHHDVEVTKEQPWCPWSQRAMIYNVHGNYGTGTVRN